MFNGKMNNAHIFTGYLNLTNMENKTIHLKARLKPTSQLNRAKIKCGYQMSRSVCPFGVRMQQIPVFSRQCFLKVMKNISHFLA